MTRIHYPRTTVSQRELLFKTWEATKDIAKACTIARVSERTFYNWKPRFETGGYEALKQFASHAPKEPNRTLEKIEQEVIELRRQNGSWGKQRIADELAKKNNWIPVISPNTVKRILQDAGLWPQPKSRSAKAKFEPVSRTAEMPGQSLNVDLCFVPAEHEDEIKLPAVSGSSGRLVVERVKSEPVEGDYPGAVFANEQLDYAQAMHAFVAASKTKDEAIGSQKSPDETEKLSVQAQKRLLGQQETALALERSRNKPLGNNSLKPDLAPLGAAKRLKMSSGVNAATNIVSNSNNANQKMKFGGKNASTFGLVYPTWAWSQVGLPSWLWSIIARANAWACLCLSLVLT
jgi:transposase